MDDNVYERKIIIISVKNFAILIELLVANIRSSGVHACIWCVFLRRVKQLLFRLNELG